MRRIKLIIAIILLSSCSVIRENVHSTSHNKLEASRESIEGTFENFPVEFELKEFRGKSFNYESNYYLWNVFSVHSGSVDHEVWKECYVQIDFLTDTKAEVRLIYKDSILDKRKIRGKLKDGYFYKRPSFVIVPLFPLVFGYNTGRYRLGLNENQNLIIEESWNVWAFALIAGSDTKAQAFAKFKRR
jgi:hypothetical protein